MKNVEISRFSYKELNVEYTKIQLGYTKIYASTNGVIGSVSTQKGETVALAFISPTFVTIIDLDRLEVWAYIDETDIGRIEVGQKAVGRCSFRFQSRQRLNSFKIYFRKNSY